MKNISTEEQLQEIRRKVEMVAEHNPIIHVSLNNKRKNVVEAKSNIIGIYDRFLCVESQVNQYLEKFTIHYIDLLTKSVIIKEL